MKTTIKYINEMIENISSRMATWELYYFSSRSSLRMYLIDLRELINLKCYRGELEEARSLILMYFEETIRYMEWQNSMPTKEKYEPSGPEHEVAPALEWGTILGLREKNQFLAEISQHGPVPKFYQQPVCYYGDFYRYYILGDEELRNQAIASLLKVSRTRYDSNYAEYNLSPKEMALALKAIFDQDAEGFHFHINKILKWHQKAADTTWLFPERGNNTHASMLFSRPVAAAIVVAKEHGIDIQLKSEVIPEYLFELSKSVK